MARGTLGINGDALQKARLAFKRPTGGHGLTRDELAKLTGISSVHIWRIETGDRDRVQDGTLLALANALGIHPAELYA